MLATTEGIIVHGCNAQGVMGSGIALKIRQKYPQAFYDYQDGIRLGKGLGDVIFSTINPKLVIANAITQQNYGRDSTVKYCSYEAIQNCFILVTKTAEQLGFTEIHYPLIGAGLANGDWSIISSIIDLAFSHLPDEINHTLWIFE